MASVPPVNLQHVIKRHSPSDRDVNVLLNTTVDIQFSVPMEKSTLNAGTVVLRNYSVPIPCTYTYTSQDRLLRIRPNTTLTPNTQYEVIIRGAADAAGTTGGIRDYANNTVLGTYAFSFTTGSLTSIPAPTLRTPDNESSVVPPANIVFSWDAVAGADHYDIQVSTMETFGTIYWSTTPGSYDPNLTSIIPSIAFTEERQYWWRVRSVDVNGNSSPWSTVASFYYGRTGADYVSPYDVPPSGSSSITPTLSFITSRPSPNMSNIPPHMLNSITIDIEGRVPEIYMTSDYVYVYSESIDGHKYFPEQVTGYDGDVDLLYNPPDPVDPYMMMPHDAADPYMNIEVSGPMPTGVAYEYVGGITRITLTPTEEDYYRVNNRYFVVIGIPGIDGQFWFTTRYEPLFTTLNAVRGAAMGLLDDFDEDIINYTIRYRSLIAIEMAIHAKKYDRDDMWWEDWKVQFDVYNPPMYVREYVKWATIVDLLSSKMINTNIGGAVHKELGSLVIERSPVNLRFNFDEQLMVFQKNMKKYENWIMGHTTPLWTIPRSTKRDRRLRNLRRPRF